MQLSHIRPRACRLTRASAIVIAAASVPWLLPATASADPIACLSFVQFCTDGRFNGHTPGGNPTAEGPEWTGANVAKAVFNQVDQAGGSVLYVGQGTGGVETGETLYLLYDYVAGPAVGFGSTEFPNSFFDVFFELPQHGEDYLVRMFANGGFAAFEKASGTPSPLTPQGNFDVSSPVWEPLSAEDLALSRFQTALTFGASPNSAVSHPIAEFELSINRVPSPGPPQGIYDPDPAFWSASVGVGSGGATALADPPISSAIFTLGPPFCCPTINPVLGPTGAPIQQPTAIPEPGTLMLLAGGLSAIALRRNRRK